MKVEEKVLGMFWEVCGMEAFGLDMIKIHHMHVWNCQRVSKYAMKMDSENIIQSNRELSK